MSDLISRQDAIDALYHVDEYNGRSVKAIMNLPSAEPERPTGRWIADENVSRWKCSCCDGLALLDDYGQMSLTEYCPHCLAKMEVEHDTSD